MVKWRVLFRFSRGSVIHIKPIPCFTYATHTSGTEVKLLSEGYRSPSRTWSKRVRGVLVLVFDEVRIYVLSRVSRQSAIYLWQQKNVNIIHTLPSPPSSQGCVLDGLDNDHMQNMTTLMVDVNLLVTVSS